MKQLTVALDIQDLKWMEEEVKRINSYGGKAFIKTKDKKITLMLEKSAPWAKPITQAEMYLNPFGVRNEHM